MNVRIRIMSIFLSIALCVSMMPTLAFAADISSGDVVIDEANFPDENFRDYVSTNFDDNEDGSLSADEIAAVTEIQVECEDVADLTGIEYFTDLIELYCDYNDLTSLDVSNNTALTDLICSENELTSLDVSGCTALKTLYCDYNQLTSLNVTGCAVLEQLACYENKLTSLDLSGNPALTELSCYENELTGLDVSNNSKLLYLECNENELTSLNVSNNVSLTYLGCSGNKLTDLDVSGMRNLEGLECDENELSDLNVKNDVALIYLNCSGNTLTSLDVSSCKKLTDLTCDAYPTLESLYIGNNADLFEDDYRSYTTIELDENNQYDLSNLNIDLGISKKAFNLSQASAWKGGNVTDGILTVSDDADQVTCTYNYQNSNSGTFTFYLKHAVKSTSTSSSAEKTGKTTPATVKLTVTKVSQAMYRLYNPNSGEHFCTASASEKNNLVSVGWKYEGIGWYAPKTSNTPVYRLYNPTPSPTTGSGEHHYTTSVAERNSLVKAGWTDEGVGWYSDDSKGVAVYRLYNPNEFNNNHHYTTSVAERNQLLSIGWNDEDIAWYGVAQ